MNGQMDGQMDGVGRTGRMDGWMERSMETTDGQSRSLAYDKRKQSQKVPLSTIRFNPITIICCCKSLTDSIDINSYFMVIRS